MTIMVIVYKMVVLLMAYCPCTVLLFFVFCLYPYCICGQFIIFLLGRPVSELWGFFGSSPIVWLFLWFLFCYYRKINMMMMMKLVA